MANLYTAPFAVDFDITLSCNQSCTHCNVTGGNPLTSEMTTSQVCQVLDEMHAAGVYELALTGGEPLCRSDWREIMLHATSKPGWQLILNTNGTLWSDDDIDFVVSQCPNLAVAVSLDGFDPASYGILRRGGADSIACAFEAAVSTIRSLAQRNHNVCVNYTITTATSQGLLPTYKLCLSLDVQRYLGIKFFPYGRGRLNLHELELDWRLWSTLLVDLTEKKLAGELESGFILSVTCPWEFYLPLLPKGFTIEEIASIWDFESPLHAPRYASTRELGCTAGITSCALSPDGSMYPCGTVSARIPELFCGNVLHEGFKSVWDTSPMLNKIRRLSLKDVGEPCVRCKYANICGGGCQARSFVASKCLGAPDPLCPIVSQAGGE